MPERSQVYKCELCGNIVEVLTAGGGDLTCCGQAMVQLAENTTDAAVEKHVPSVEKTTAGWVVNVGSVDHPMTDDHYIEWVELIAGDSTYRTYLNPNDKPHVLFNVDDNDVTIRAYCNLHGLWKA